MNSHSISTTNTGQPKQNEFPAHGDIPGDSDIAGSIKDDSPGFRQVHYRLFETITASALLDDTDKHPFHMKWRKALFKGLHTTSNWERVAKILNISYIKDYIDFVNECPHLKEIQNMIVQFDAVFKDVENPEDAVNL